VEETDAREVLERVEGLVEVCTELGEEFRDDEGVTSKLAALVPHLELLRDHPLVRSLDDLAAWRSATQASRKAAMELIYVDHQAHPRAFDDFSQAMGFMVEREVRADPSAAAVHLAERVLEAQHYEDTQARTTVWQLCPGHPGAAEALAAAEEALGTPVVLAQLDARAGREASELRATFGVERRLLVLVVPQGVLALLGLEVQETWDLGVSAEEFEECRETFRALLGRGGGASAVELLQAARELM
jgi:hypothetical protein